MPEYGVFVYSPAPADPMALTPEYEAALDQYPVQVKKLGGQAVAGFAFAPSTTAKSVRGGTVTDGPFLAAREVIAGYYVLLAPDLDTAVRIAALNPATKDGGVEVRPLFVPPDE